MPGVFLHLIFYILIQQASADSVPTLKDFGFYELLESLDSASKTLREMGRPASGELALWLLVLLLLLCAKVR